MSRVKPWRERAREQIADCHIFTVERARAESPVDASEHDVYRVLSRDWVQVDHALVAATLWQFLDEYAGAGTS